MMLSTITGPHRELIMMLSTITGSTQGIDYDAEYYYRVFMNYYQIP